MEEEKIATETVAVSETAESAPVNVTRVSFKKSNELGTRSTVNPITIESTSARNIDEPSATNEASPKEARNVSSHHDDGIGHLQEVISADNCERDDLSMDSEMDYEIETEWEEDSKRMTRRELFDHRDSTAVHLKTDTHSLIISKLPPVTSDRWHDSEMALIAAEHRETVNSAVSGDLIHHYDIYEEMVDVEKTDSDLDFFERIRHIPNIDEISSGTTEEDVVSRKESIDVQVGKFVDPLTGIDMPKALEDTALEEETDRGEEFTSEEEEHDIEKEGSEGFSLEDFDKDFQDEVEKKIEQKATEDGDMLDILLKKHISQGKIIFVDEKIDEEAEKAKQLAQHTDRFLNELLRQVLLVCENQENTKLVRHSLDKKKIIREIHKVIPELVLEMKVREFLSHKAMEYFRRRKLLRYILPEKTDHALQEYERYRESITHLDELLGQEAAMRKKNHTTIELLSLEGDEKEEDAKLEERKFKQLVRNTFRKEGMNHLAEFVEKELRTLSIISEEISQVRTVLIMRQHSLGRLKSQLDDLENIGAGLRVADYENLERETIALSKKIEERSYDLSKLHERFNTTLHTLAHSKLRCEMVLDNIKVQVNILGRLDDEKISCRKVVYELKMKRQKIYRQTSDLSLQFGLLSKPALMKDYDLTFERVLKKRNIVEKLRHTHQELEQKYKRLELSIKQQK